MRARPHVKITTASRRFGCTYQLARMVQRGMRPWFADLVHSMDRQGLSCDEIAEILGENSTAVRVALWHSGARDPDERGWGKRPRLRIQDCKDYTANRITLTDLARKHETSVRMIEKELTEIGIPIRRNRKRKPLPPDWIARYRRAETCIMDISRELDMSPQWVREDLVAAGCEIDARGWIRAGPLGRSKRMPP